MTEPIADIELNIVRDMAKRAWLLVVPAAIIVYFFRSIEGSLAVVFAALVVLGNLFIAAEITRRCVRISPSAVLVGALSGFVVRLIIIFVIALIVQNFEIIDTKVWLLAVAIGHITLLAWETRYLSFSLAHPGVKPTPQSGKGTSEN